jgi:hypothetical protein
MRKGSYAVFNEEEEKLDQWKETIEKMEVHDDRLELAIREGFSRAKNEKLIKRRPYIKRGIWSAAIAAILFLTIVTSIRVSPAFASAIASIPGMEKIVNLIQDNKGLQAAVKNEYYQDIGVTSENDGIAVTLDGVIADNSGMILFFSLEISSKNDNASIDEVKLFDQKGTPIESRSIGISFPGGNGNNSMTSTIDIQFNEPLTSDNLSLQFNMKQGEEVKQFDLPFTLEKRVVESKVYTLNETAVVEGQRITIKSITIEPIRVAVHVEMDSNNTKKIFKFEDLRLVNEKGEAWSSINNGTTARLISDDEQIIYLQSNYFENPKRLSLQFNKLMAVDKDEAFIIVDTTKSEIIQQPKDNIYSKVEVGSDFIIFFYSDNGEIHSFPLWSFTDKNNKEFVSTGSSSSGTSEEKELKLTLPNESFKNPIRLPLSSHPSWIKGDVKIKIK